MKYFLIMAFITTFMVGCGTIQSQSSEGGLEGKEYIGPFSGVVYDGKWSVCNPLHLVDLPVSFAADFVIMPYTIYRANEKCRLEKCEAPQ